MQRYNLLRITNKCNFNCKFCNVWEEIGINSINKELSLEYLDKKIKNLDSKFISISGGEPLLVINKYLSIFKKYSKSGYTFDIQTTGYFLTKSLLKSLVYSGIKKFFISFHIHIPKLYNYLVGGNFFEKVYINLKNLDKCMNELGIEVILNPVFNKLTYKYLDSYFNFVYTEFKNIREVSLSFIQPRDKALNNKKLLLTFDDYMKLEKKKDFLDKWFDRGFKIYNPFCGLPLCCLGWYKYTNYCTDVVENFNLIKQGNDIILKETYYLSKCYDCKWQYLCKGYWKLGNI